MKDWMKWVLIAVLLVLVVGGALLANKWANKPVGDIETTAEVEEESVYTEADQVLLSTTYEEYLAMTAEEQETFKNSFSSLKAYTKWKYNAKLEYNSKDVTIIGGGDQTVDINDIIGN